MKLAIFGATGGTGRALTAQALAAGHQVTALVRAPERADLPAAVRIVKGDVNDPQAVEKTVEGSDAVISVLGTALTNSFGDAGMVGTHGMPHIIGAMQRNGVRRLVVVSAYGAGESREKVGLAFRTAMATALRGVYADKNAMEPIIRASGLDWTIVRPTNLKNGPATGNVVVEPPGPLGLGNWISRADVAAFLLRCFDDRATAGRAIVITGG